jgi:ERF superfamily
MQRSSQSIAALAAALAKAQCELVNPEKSLVGTIEAGPRGGTERAFRYAPLSSGLDIVRKTLGQHEIATVQTTALDQAAGIVNLTTVLAHSSGEWIASDWPVCAIGETATPHRMGAALTYARRYALFTLVGIAGEDDLDAPDLVTPTTPSSGPEKTKGTANTRLSGSAQPYPCHRAPVRHNSAKLLSPAAPALAPEASTQLRNRLLAELKDLGEADEAALWARRSLLEKNRLNAADAQCIDETFQARLAGLTTDAMDGSPIVMDMGSDRETARPPPMPSQRESSKKAGPKRQEWNPIDKSALALGEPRRVRDRDHVKYVAKQPCLICGRQPADAHHLRFTQSQALGRKVSDEFTVPLCRDHHREVHRCGDETTWWRGVGIDPAPSALALWRKSHPLPPHRGNKRGDRTPNGSGNLTPNP